MPLASTSVLVPLVVALVAGAWLGYALTTSRAGRSRATFLGLFFLAFMPWVGVRLAADVLEGLALIALLACWDTRGLRERCQAAQSLGASEWRVFWRVWVPERSLILLAGAVIAWLRLVLQRATSAA